VRNLLRTKPENAQWFYGSVGTHAYLIIKSFDNSFMRIDLGGSGNYSVEYLSVSQVLKEKLPQQDIVAELPEQKALPLKPNLSDILSNVDNKKILLQAPESFVLSLLERGKIHSESTLVISNFSQFDFDKKTLKIHQNEAVYWEEDGFLADFIKEANEHPDQRFRLIILWDKLREIDRIRVNTILEKTIQNRTLPENVYIISITQEDVSQEKSNEFLEKRKALLFNTLNNHPWLVLTGKTGVGKSRFIQHLHEKEKEKCTIYHELNDIEAWANDKSDKKKILFLDEYNLQNKHLTLLAPIGSGNPRILYKGKILSLDDNHIRSCTTCTLPRLLRSRLTENSLAVNSHYRLENGY
jgi:hypothetical protein